MEITLLNHNNFDATQDTTFHFRYEGLQLFKVEYSVKDNTTNAVVNSNTIETMLTTFTIPKNTLKNGTSYNMQVRVFTKDDQASLWSNVILFSCLTTPVFNLSNLVNDYEIKTGSFVVSAYYFQAEGDQLNSGQAILYTMDNTPIYRSNVEYFSINDATVSFTIPNLIDNQRYKIGIEGYTISGMFAQTPIVRFSVNYDTPEYFSLVQLENIEDEGSIRVSHNIFFFEGHYIGDDGKPTFIRNPYNDGFSVELLKNNKIKYESKFNIDKQFYLQILGRNFISSQTVFVMENANQMQLELIYMCGEINGFDSPQSYFILRHGYKNSVKGFVMSNYIDQAQDNQQTFITLKKKDGLYSVVCGVV